MTIRINSNQAFTRATNQLNQFERDSFIRRSRISSGLGINTSGDDVGGLTASEGMRAELHGLIEGTRNTENSLNLLQSAEGAMSEIGAMLIRMRELAVQGSNGALNEKNREVLDAEFAQLKENTNRIAKMATYNGHSLLSGFGNSVNSLSSNALENAATGVESIKLFAAAAGEYTFTDNPGDNTLTLANETTSQTISISTLLANGKIASGSSQVADFDRLGIQVTLNGAGVTGAAGSYSDGALDGKKIFVEEGIGGSFQLGSDALPADRIEYDISDMSLGGGIVQLSEVNLSTQESARNAIRQVDDAIQQTTKERGFVGAMMNRLQHTLNSTASSIENLKNSQSTIRDADFALESSRLARNEILAQSSMAAIVKSKLPAELMLDLLN
ncbi:MAG: hypothetical protein CME16_05645 [Gemmatimonadetes bacterium]|nr:hypothetical protein [Gemmatimonadota bacterium]